MKANLSDRESVDSVMKRVSHADLLSHYLGISSLPVLINSPLRNDMHPSFFIYSPDGRKVLYRDYATGDKGDIYSLLQRQKGVTFSQLIRSISSEKAFSGNSSEFSNTSSKGTHFAKSTIDLRVKVREWRDYDIAYWESYGISLKWLKYAEVYPISHKIVYKDGQRFVFPAARLAYVFVERKEGKVSLKVYSPFNQKYKWQSSMDRSVWGLWTKIPKYGDNIIIGSSVKDCLNIWSNTGIPAICMQGEAYDPKPQIIEELKGRYHNIIVFFDNDYTNEKNPGRTDSIKLSEKFGLVRVEIPSEYEAKDPSDLYKKYGKEKYLKIMFSILKPVLWKSGEK